MEINKFYFIKKKQFKFINLQTENGTRIVTVCSIILLV